MSEYWFRPKTYGYGATPINWKGWASTLAFAAVIAAIAGGFLLSASGRGSLDRIILGAVLLAALVAGFTWFAQSKTEGEWRWRWGKD